MSNIKYVLKSVSLHFKCTCGRTGLNMQYLNSIFHSFPLVAKLRCSLENKIYQTYAYSTMRKIYRPIKVCTANIVSFMEIDTQSIAKKVEIIIDENKRNNRVQQMMRVEYVTAY